MIHKGAVMRRVIALARDLPALCMYVCSPLDRPQVCTYLHRTNRFNRQTARRKCNPGMKYDQYLAFVGFLCCGVE